MKKSMKFAAALAGAAVVVVGGTAFTGGSTFPTDPTVAGYGTQTVSGFTATEVDYTYSADNEQLTGVLFKSADTTMVVANASAVLQLSGATGADNACVVAEIKPAAVRTGTSITCTLGANNDTDDITGYSLAVTTDMTQTP